LTLLEAALLLSLSALVLAVFVPSFVRRVRTNKIDEAPELLAELSRRTAAYYAAHPTGCLPPGAGPAPGAPARKPEELDFSSPETPGHATWRALAFQPGRPVRFSYQYLPRESGCGLRETEAPIPIVFRAQGDLDGDGVLSTFELRAKIEQGRFTPAEELRVHQRTE
jgi:hypothetical protein